MTLDQTTNLPQNPGPHLSDETLSDFASGRLSEPERLAALRHAETCAECAAAMRDYAAITNLLGGLPAPRPRRNFQISEEEARARRRLGWRFPSLMPSLPALRAATLAVAMLLLVVIGADRLTQPSDNSGNQEQFSAMVAPTQTAASAETRLNPAPIATTEIGSASDSAAAVTTATPPESAADASLNEAEAPAPAAAVGSGSGESGSDGASSGAAAGSAADTKAVAPVEAASPTVVATPMPPTATPTATVPATPAPATPDAIAASKSDGGSDRRDWRVAELGLTFLLVWLVVTYVGVHRTNHSPR